MKIVRRPITATSPPPLRSWIGRLALAGLLAAMLTAIAAGWFSWTQQRAQLGLNLRATTRAIIGSVDREIDRAVALAQGLLASEALARGDIAVFEGEARKAVKNYPYTILLNPSDSGRQLINTYYAAGTQLPDFTEPDWIDPKLGAGEIALKPLRQGRISGRWVLIVQAPVRDERNELRFALNVVVPVSTLQRVLDEQTLPSDWLAVIVDKSGKIVARRPGGEKYAGAKPVYRPDSPTWPADDTDFYGRTLEGFEVVTTRAISAKYGLSTAVAVPTSSLFGQFLMPVAVASLGGFAMAGLTFIVMSLLTARLVRGIRVLARATDALGRGEETALPPFPVRELAMVGEALQRAARTLAGNRRELEERIAEVSRNFQREAEERQNAEAALAQSQKVEAIGQLTGGIAHDFNNLLAAVVGNLDLLRRRAAWDARAAGYVENALAAAERGTKLTSQLLVFSRSQQLDLKPVVIADVIEDMRDMLTRTLGPQIRITIELEEGRVAVLSDRTQLELAVLNLAINARDAMPEGGRLTISTVPLRLNADPELQPGDYVRVSVSDTGTGMTPETAARAFDPFYTTKGVGKGTGLGLSQVFGMASRGAGTARIETRLGHGTTVHLFLRQTNAEPGIGEHSTGASLTSALPQLQILVIDDDPDVRRLLRDVLSERGLVPREAEDGQAGLEEIERALPDLVLLDYAMPGLSGAQVAKIAKDRHPHLQIIFVTGFADTAAIEQSVGRDALVLRKPFRLADLDALLVQVAGHVGRDDLVP